MYLYKEKFDKWFEEDRASLSNCNSASNMVASLSNSSVNDGKDFQSELRRYEETQRERRRRRAASRVSREGEIEGAVDGKRKEKKELNDAKRRKTT